MSYRHQFPCVHNGQLILFQTDQNVSQLISIRGAVSPSGVRWQTTIDHEGYAVLENLDSGERWDWRRVGTVNVPIFPRTFGAGTVAVWMNGEEPELYLMREGDGSVVYVYDKEGQELRRYQRAPTTQRPLWKILEDGTPLLGNDPERERVRVIDGIAFYDWDQAGDYICGAGDGWNGSRNSPCIMVRHLQTGEMRAWWYQTSELPWIVSLPDGPRLILSGADAPAPLRWEDLSPWEAVRPEPAPVPAPISITFGPAPQGVSLWMGCTTTGVPDPRTCPGNFTWSGDPNKPNKADDPRPLMDMAGPWEEYWGDRDWFAGLWLTDGAADPVQVDKEIANAQARGLSAVVIHCDHDSHRANAITAAKRVSAAGLTPLLLAHAYHHVEDFVAVRDEFREHGWRWGVTINCRTLNKDIEAFAETIREAMFSLTLAGCDMLVLWGDFAGFERDWPDAGRLLRELAANIQTPTLKPGEQPAPVPVPAPPADKPKIGSAKPGHPTGDRPKSKGMSKGEKIAAGAAGLGALIAALFKAFRGGKA